MKKNKLDILKKQSSGFKVPKAYFDTFEDDVFSKLSVKEFPKKSGYKMPENYLETIEANVLNEINTSEFSVQQQQDVPKGYFDTVEDTVFKKIEKESSKEPKVIKLKPKLVTISAAIAIAASILLLFTLFTNETKASYNLETLSASEVEIWIEDGYISLDAYQIAEVYSDVNFEDEFDKEDIELLDYINGTDIESVLLID